MGAALCPWKKCEESIIDDAECIIYGGWIKAGRIQGLGRIKKAAEDRGKKFAVFAVGAAGSDMKDVIDKMWLQNQDFQGEKAFTSWQSDHLRHKL